MIEITIEEILEDLCYPFPPPGRWELPEPSPAHQPDRLVQNGADHAARPDLDANVAHVV